MNLVTVLIYYSILTLNLVFGHPEKGKWQFEALSPFPKTLLVTKSMYSDGILVVKIRCPHEGNISVKWILQKTPCWKDHIESIPVNFSAELYFQHLKEAKTNLGLSKALKSVTISQKETIHCDNKGTYLIYHEKKSKRRNGLSESLHSTGGPSVARNNDNIPALYVMPADGIYMFSLRVTPDIKQNQNSSIFIKIEMKNSYGYLSAADYPLLPFYGIMCAVYFVYGVGWLLVSFMRWRELLRVQYWIGAVILLGMLEKAVFTGVYESVNERGDFIPSLLYFAEFVSCIKRTLSRILVIIVAFGFGIVKPRLGTVLNRMVFLGLLYFLIAIVESFIRVMNLDNIKTALSHKETFAIVPLALVETVICYWIFSALTNTIRTLSLRRNTVKLQLYKHFKNTLAFSVIVSTIFMTYCIFYQNLNICVQDWKQLWVNAAFWHVLFAFILLVIMILWRPTNNNQRFAFSPLLDEASEDEEEKLVAADVSDTMKFRSIKNNSVPPSNDSRALEEDLQWLDENIPTAMMDKGFPSVDSDEEVILTKFEMSKMN